MLHRFADDDDFQMRLQLSQLAYTVSSEAQATALAENYVGMPFIDLTRRPHRVQRGRPLHGGHHEQHHTGTVQSPVRSNTAPTSAGPPAAIR